MDKRLEKYYNRDLDIWGLPQQYKGVNFYPIKLKDVRVQEIFYKVFQYPKNNIPDKQILKMSYLKYLFLVNGSVENKNIIDGLLELLKYSTKINDIDFMYTKINNNLDNDIENINIFLVIGDKEFIEQDFDIIRGILLEQNGLSIEYIEEYNSELEEKLKYVDRDLRDITIEDQIIVFVSLNNLSLKSIEDYTLYQFKKHFVRSTLLLDYKLYSPLEISGQIKSKTGEKLIRHYMEHLGENGRYSSIMIPQEKLFGMIPGLQDEKGNVPVPLPN